jgi:hypothetical protein
MKVITVSQSSGGRECHTNKFFFAFFALTIATKARGQFALANMGRNVSLKCLVRG